VTGSDWHGPAKGLVEKPAAASAESKSDNANGIGARTRDGSRGKTGFAAWLGQDRAVL
jgi:hypothetical protein